MKLTIIGATGRTGIRMLRKAIVAGKVLAASARYDNESPFLSYQQRGRV